MVGDLTDTLQHYVGNVIDKVEYLRAQRMALLDTKGTNDWSRSFTYAIKGIDALLDDLYKQIGYELSNLNEGNKAKEVKSRSGSVDVQT